MMRVVHGGDKSLQLEKFQKAFRSYLISFNKDVEIKVEYMGPKEKEKNDGCEPTHFTGEPTHQNAWFSVTCSDALFKLILTTSTSAFLGCYASISILAVN